MVNRLKVPLGYIFFAEVGAPHGLKGAFFLRCKDSKNNLDALKKILLETKGEFKEFLVSKVYVSGGRPVVSLVGIVSREQLELIKNSKLYIHESELADTEGVLVNDLIDCSVVRSDSALIGKVISVVSFGAQENLEIQLSNSRKTVLIPFLEPFIKNIDLEKKQIEVDRIEEFFED